jgi:crotonobetainyl-CoA:carnitine CoA-transferase CaiB-like acyl-CoA transferase
MTPRPRTSAQPPPGPLAGLRVIDCSTVLAGPLCTMILGDLGASVIKVEPPEGDATRGWGPPWVAAPGVERVAAYYLSVNRNKRSLRLDLATDAGRAVLGDLLRTADAVVENQRVGGFERLGFSEARLAELNPALVHLAISGYGPTGPSAAKPGYDFVIQAAAGLMSITGRPDADGGRPTKVGVAISDVVTGLFGAIGLLGALMARHAGAAQGQRVDVSILESTLAVLVNQAHNAFATGRAPGRLGNAHPNIVPYETFATADGEIAVAVGSERQWPRLCATLGLPELATEARFADNDGRVRHRDELRPILAERFASRTSAAWLEALDASAIPAGPINDVLAAFADPQAQAREMTVDVEHPAFGKLRQVGLPITLSATPASIRAAPPRLGEHSTEILQELGYDDGTIARLVADGVV